MLFFEYCRYTNIRIFTDFYDIFGFLIFFLLYESIIIYEVRRLIEENTVLYNRANTPPGS